MKPSLLNRVVFPCAFGVCLLLAALSARAQGTLYFVPSLNAEGNITELWSSVENWYFALTPMPVPANRLPEAGDTVIIELSEYACVVDVASVEIGTLITAAPIEGGDFLVQNVQSQNTIFNGTTLNVQYEWQSDNDQMINGAAIIQSGGLLYLDGATLSVNNSTVDDIGQIELMDGGEIDFTAGTNQLTVAPNAQFTGSGNTELYNAPGSPLLFDNNGLIQSEDGTLVIESDSIFWTNSSGKGYFTNITSNAVIEITGPFAVQTNCTNFVTGPGTFELLVGNSTVVNGILQVGTRDPSPGNFDYRAYNLTGAGAINITGSPGMPSRLIWESGTFEGPSINIDSNSLFIITNGLYLKTISDCVVYNFGTATWETNGGLLELDNGAVFDNIGTFIAENSSDIQGGAGANASYFNNGGTFVVDLAANNLGMSFTQDNEPAPSAYLINAGEVDVQTGALFLEWGTNSGQYNVAAGAQLHFWQGTNAQKATATFTGPGELALDFADFWIETNLAMAGLQMENNGTIDGPGDLTINGLLSLDYGTVKGSGSLNISSNATLLIVSNSITLYRNVTNAGTATMSNAGIYAGQPLTWNNLPTGSLDLVGVASLGNTIAYAGPPPALYNGGALSNSGPTNLTAQINWNVTNSGTIVANPFNLVFSQSLTQVSGSVQLNAGAMLNVPSSYGHIFEIEGGILEGQGEVSASIFNSGTIHPGDSPGILTLGFGTLTNEFGAELAVDIAGTAPGQYSQLLSAGGAVWLNDMVLKITVDNGFAPPPGAVFVIVSNAQVNGKFSSIFGTQAPGVILAPQYTANSVSLVATENPLVLAPSITNNTFSFGFHTVAGLTNVVEFTPTLTPQDWQPLTNIVGDGLIHFVTDNLSTNTSRFYRLAFE